MRKSQALKLYLELGKNLKSFTEEITKRGFSKIDQGAYKLVYSKNRLGYVVKIANSGNDEFAPIPQEIKKYYLKPYFCDNQIVIQQKAKTTNGANERTFNTIKKIAKNRNSFKSILIREFTIFNFNIKYFKF